MTAFEIPLTPEPQTLSVPLGTKTYKLTVRWNPASASWVVDFADEQGVVILNGVPLVTGTNLLEQFDYLDFGGQLIAQTDHDVDAVPTFANLGSAGRLYFVVS